MTKEFVLTKKEGGERKHSVVYEYRGAEYNFSIYVPRKLLEELGYPGELRVMLGV